VYWCDQTWYLFVGDRSALENCPLTTLNPEGCKKFENNSGHHQDKTEEAIAL